MIQILSNYKNYLPKLHAQAQEKDQISILTTLSEMKLDILKHQDQAVLKYTQLFDQVEDPNFQFQVTASEIADAYKNVPESFVVAIKKAKENIEWFHRHQLPNDFKVEKPDGSVYGMRYQPLEKAGLYVPGGRAPYPSTVLMDAIPAYIAGVEEIVIATPPGKDGKVAPQILVASDICGVSEIYKVGGAQSVFALAYGTESIPKVDKIVGPGNIYVTLAKQMVYGVVDIDKPAGPSEACVYVNDEKYVKVAAAELLSQLEHDPLAIAVGISESQAVLEKIQAEMAVQVEQCSRKAVIEKSIQNSALILTQSIGESIDVMNQVATEHLVLLVQDPEPIADKIKHAGAIFMGPFTPVAAGDYFAGPNHVLPTAGAARFSSPLGVMDFMKFSTILSYSYEKLKESAPFIQAITEMEGFDAHHRSVMMRL